MKLRDYQIAIDTKLWELQGKKVLQLLPTGTGKGTLITKNVWDAYKKGLSVLIVVPMGELVEDLYARITSPKPYLKPFVSRLGMGKENTFNKISIGVYKSIANRLDVIPEYDIVIGDEIHRSPSNTYSKILKYFPNAWHIGYTATPERTDGQPLGHYYDYINSYENNDIGWFIDQGYLADYYLKSWKTDYKAKSSKDDLVEQDLHFNRGELIADACKEWERFALGEKTLVYATTTEHCYAIVEKFNTYFDGKYKFAYIGSTLTATQRRDTLESYLYGELTGLVNVSLITEGIDIPLVSCLSLQRFVGSPGLLTQIWGRGLRPKPNGKRLTILDHAGNAHFHGSPRFQREYSLFPDITTKGSPEKLKCSGCGLPLVFKNVVVMKGEEGYKKLCECGTLNEWLIIPEKREKREAPIEVDGELVEYKEELDDWQYIKRIMESTNMLHQKKVKRIIEHKKIGVNTKQKALKVLGLNEQTIEMYLG
jgi:superfamily II DNA or RNA helicase